MNSSINKLIIIAGVILVVLIAVTILISSSSKSNQSTQKSPTLIPTRIFEGTGGQNLSPQEIQRLEKRAEEINNNVLSLDQANRLDELKNKLPFSSDDFAIGYSEALGQFYIQKKTPQADAALQKFLQDNGFWDVYQQFPDLFITTGQPVDQAILQAEQNFSNTKQQKITPIAIPTQQEKKSEKQQQIEKDERMLKSFAEFAGSLFTFSTGGSSSLKDIINSAPTPSGGGGGGKGEFTDRRISQALMDILLEAGNKVNIDPKLIAAIMSRECATVLFWPQNEILSHSTLRPGDPCFTNGTADGPMQFIRSTWKIVSPRVKELVGHQPNVHNIRDAVIGGAFKLKAGAQAKDHFNLTQQEVLNAAHNYNSGGCPSYCQDVWEYYNNH